MRLWALFLVVFLPLNGAELNVDRLHHSAETAMMHHDYVRAREAFSEMLKLSSLTPDREADITIRLSMAEKELGNLARARELLEGLDLASLTPHRQREGYVRLAQVINDSGEPERALLVLQELETRVPRKVWRREDRAYYTALTIGIDDHYQGLLSDAERAVDLGLYEEAAPLYKELFSAIEGGTFLVKASSEAKRAFEDKVRYRLGEAFYQMGRYEEAIDTLSPVRSRKVEGYSSSTGYQCLHLLGLSHKRLGQREAALATFLTYLEAADDEGVAWEAGLCYFEMGFKEQAEALFSEVTGGHSDQLGRLAEVYLSCIDFSRSDFASVEERLRLVSEALDVGDPLRCEAAFLRAEAAFASRDYPLAIQLFDEARGSESAKWLGDALYGLGWSYLNLAMNLNTDPRTRQILFGQAEEAFSQLDEERGLLALARTYLAQKETVGEGKVRYQVESIIEKPEEFSSKELCTEALLIRAEVAPTYKTKEGLFKRLCDPTYQETPLYPIGWYRRALNELRAHHYEAACGAFSRAYPLLRRAGDLRAALCLKSWGAACFNVGSDQARLQAYQLLTRLINDSELFEALEEPDEAIYLLGLVGSVLGEEYVRAAEEDLHRVVVEYATGAYAAPSLNVLGTLLFQRKEYKRAEEAFLKLARCYPTSPLASGAWFWSAECAEWQDKPFTVIQERRRAVFEKYPDSTYAAESYFNTYPFSTYMEGDKGAIDHLQAMPRLYPNSPFLVLAHYLHGLHLKGEQKTKEARQAFALSDGAFEEEAIAPANLEYFRGVRSRAMIEQALIELEFQNYGPAEELFVEVIDGCTGMAGYPRILEEAHFGLSQVRLAGGKREEAAAILGEMLERYHAAGIETGYYLSRAWYHQGRLLMGQGDFEVGRRCLTHSREAARGGILSINQRLDLWMQESHCAREKGDFDEAMLLLSKVINHEAASPLRVEAMYQRAMLYSLQGRRELAIKQLEATAKKNGLWAVKAKEALKEEYGLDIHDS